MAVQGEEPNVLVVEFTLDLGMLDQHGKAFSEARQSVLDVAAQVGLAGRLRPPEGCTDGYDWFESVSPDP